MYAKSVSAIIEHNNIFYHSYADDTQLYIQCDNNEKSVRCAISHLEQCISEICEWMKQNSLKINQDKTEYIIFSSKPDQYKYISLTVGRDIIHPGEYIRILGVTLDSQMNMHQHIANTCRSTYMHIRKINSIRQYLCKNSTASLVNATVLTRLYYCNVQSLHGSSTKILNAQTATCPELSCKTDQSDPSTSPYYSNLDRTKLVNNY